MSYNHGRKERKWRLWKEELWKLDEITVQMRYMTEHHISTLYPPKKETLGGKTERDEADNRASQAGQATGGSNCRADEKNRKCNFIYTGGSQRRPLVNLNKVYPTLPPAENITPLMRIPEQMTICEKIGGTGIHGHRRFSKERT